MAAPTPSLDPEMIIDKNKNLSVTGTPTGTTISTKTAYFKYGVGASSDKAIMEVITKDSAGLTLNEQIQVSDQTIYVVEAIDKTPVKFASGTPLVSQNVNVKFPRPEVKNITPEKVVTFLIFKK
jgi:hypothetical protein